MPARHLARTARRRLLWLLAGFALCQAVLAVAIDVWLDQVRDPEYTAKLARLKARLAEAPGRPLVLVLGTSRTAYALDGASLSVPAAGQHPVVFNFGIMGCGPLLQLATLHRLLDAGIRPDLLYAEVMPALLVASEGRALEEKMLDAARLRAGEVIALLPYYREPHRPVFGWGLGRLLPCYRHPAELRALAGLGNPAWGGAADYPGPLDGHGWHPRPDDISPEERQRATAMALGQYDAFCASPQVAAEPVRALEALLERCRREGIPVELVLMPEGKAFRALYTPEITTALKGLFARLQERWGVTIVNARDWVDDAGFWDTHHMLVSGARQFTEHFGREPLARALRALSRRTRDAEKS